MSSLGCVGVSWLPSSLGVFVLVAVLVSYIWASLTGSFALYGPFISETGASASQSGVFSMFLFIASVWGCFIMLIRYAAVRRLTQNSKVRVWFLNGGSLFMGLAAIFGNLIVASYSVMSSKTLHNAGAYTMLLSGVLYVVLQTCLTCSLYPHHNGRFIFCLRFLLTLISVVALIVFAWFHYVAEETWSDTGAVHPGHKRVPGDQGFLEFTVSATAEWCLAITFMLFFLTFMREFRRVALRLDVYPLVYHFDDNIEVTRLPAEVRPLLRRKTSSHHSALHPSDVH
ncbi:DNA damage-regulated autophagy modulator protein 1-like [Ornithodoros turicata]|uniref:DNA damage-regulated autophagy modulator protein 1-like n=1 Tax=Ornithodoros turicata TaxID=34597 RepID=UPI003138AA67